MTQQFNMANGVDYVLIAFYFVAIVWVGMYAARKNKNTDEYFRGGGRIPWLVAGLSNWVSGYSAFMFVAAAGFTYLNGLGAVVIFTSAFWAYLLGYMVFGVRWRRARIRSPLEFLTKRYSPSTTYFYSLTAIIPQIVGIGQGLYILCIFVSTALGFNEREFDFGLAMVTGFQLSIILTGIVMVVYSVIGGLWAAVLSDTVQAIIITVMTVVIFPVTFMYLGRGEGFLGGFDRLLQEAPEGYFTVSGDAANPLFLIAYLINVVLGYNVGWQIVQRYHSVPDERDTKKMALLCAVLSVVGPLMWILPVMGSRIIFPDIDTLWPSFAVPAEASFVSLAMKLLPHGLIGFVVSAILSATLGAANDSFNWLAATLTRDVYAPVKERLTGRVPSDRNQLMTGRLIMFIMGIFGIAVALYIPALGGAFQFALVFYSLTAAFAMPVALGLLYTRTPWWSGMASCSAAIAAAVFFMVTDTWNEQAFIRNMLSESVVAASVFFGSAFFYREKDPRNASILAFARDLSTPALETGTQEVIAGLRVYGLIGRICFALGGILIACAILPSTEEAPAVLNLAAGSLLLVIGAAAWLGTRKAVHPLTEETI